MCLNSKLSDALTVGFICSQSLLPFCVFNSDKLVCERLHPYSALPHVVFRWNTVLGTDLHIVI